MKDYVFFQEMPTKVLTDHGRRHLEILRQMENFIMAVEHFNTRIRKYGCKPEPREVIF